MLAHGILRPVLPEIVAADRLAALVLAEQSAGIPADALRRLAALLPPDSSVAEQIGARLKLSNKARKRLSCAAAAQADGKPRALAYELGIDCAVDRLLLAGRESDAAALVGWNPPRLPIGGGALIERGLTAGPVVARTLKSIEQRWVAEEFPQGSALEAIVAEEVASAR